MKKRLVMKIQMCLVKLTINTSVIVEIRTGMNIRLQLHGQIFPSNFTNAPVSNTNLIV
jgi:hypothetical protein